MPKLPTLFIPTSTSEESIRWKKNHWGSSQVGLAGNLALWKKPFTRKNHPAKFTVKIFLTRLLGDMFVNKEIRISSFNCRNTRGDVCGSSWMLDIVSSWRLRNLTRNLHPSPHASGYTVVNNCWGKSRLSGIVAAYKLCRDCSKTASLTTHQW